MIVKNYKVCDKAGLHLRPASMIAGECLKFKSDIKLRTFDSEFDAKSTMSLMLAKLEFGSDIALSFSGSDENEAATVIEELITADFCKKLDNVFFAEPLVEGLAIAKAMVISNESLNTNIHRPVIEASAEIKAIEKALKAVSEDCLLMFARLKEKQIKEAEIFKAHSAMLNDALFISSINEKVKSGNKSAVDAVCDVIDGFISNIQNSDNKIMKQRAADLKDLKYRIIKHLNGNEDLNETQMEGEFILIAHEILPSNIASFETAQVKGIISEAGSKTSHAAILSKSLGIPMILCKDCLHSRIKDGQLIAIDTEKNEVIIEPDEECYVDLKRRVDKKNEEKAQLQKYAKLFSRTKDGRSIMIECNIDSIKDIDMLHSSGLDGIGLFRTEYLFMNRESAPDEDEQFEAYRVLAQTFGNKEVIIRTLDTGADKKIGYLDFPDEEAPLLGIRGIRYSIYNKELFLTQCRAILRASVFGNLHIMFPFISTIKELREAKLYLEEAKNQLDKQGTAYNSSVKTGVMIELPSAAVMADLLAREADFFSIGTNDLLQYTFAAARGSECAERIIEPYDPVLFRMICGIAKAGRDAGIPVGICGIVAEDPKLLPVWIATGINKLSVGRAMILILKKRIAELDMAGSGIWIDKLLNCATHDEASAILNNIT